MSTSTLGRVVLSKFLGNKSNFKYNQVTKNVRLFSAVAGKYFL